MARVAIMVFGVGGANTFCTKTTARIVPYQTVDKLKIHRGRLWFLCLEL
ncbi:hypothetical protein [Bacillus sp. mrc49]|nr:hypothetical protein [Bacillus sp. mrc49]